MPIFIALIGIELNVQSLVSVIPLFFALLEVAIAVKIVARYPDAKIVDFNSETSLAIGFLMNRSGMVELVIASISFAIGAIDLTLFSIPLAIGLVSCIIAPITSGALVSRAKSKGSEAVAVREQR